MYACGGSPRFRRMYSRRLAQVNSMRATVLIVAALGLSPPALAFTFAEGYSSAEPGAPALLYYRAFTLDEGRES